MDVSLEVGSAVSQEEARRPEAELKRALSRIGSISLSTMYLSALQVIWRWGLRALSWALKWSWKVLARKELQVVGELCVYVCQEIPKPEGRRLLR